MPCYFAVTNMWKSAVLTGNAIHHRHIMPFGISNFVSRKTWKGTVHLEVIWLVYERHSDVWCDGERY